MKEELSVEITAKIDQFKKGLEDSIKELDKLTRSEKELKKEFDKGNVSQEKYYKTLAKNTVQAGKLRTNISKFRSSLGGTSTAFEKTAQSTASGTAAMTSFSRVVQDAPFGIMGVANNITNLTEQFGALQKRTGSAGGALKLMLKDLKGFGGLTLGISLVTSLMVAFGDELSNISLSNDRLAKSQNAVNKAINDFYGGSVTKLNTYVKILENVNTGEKERLRITNELIDEVPSLTKADFAYGNNLDIVKKKIGAYVLAQASRIEADTLVQENSEKLAQKARITTINQIKDETQRVEAMRKFLKEQGSNPLKAENSVSFMGLAPSQVKKTNDDIVDEFKTFGDKLTKEVEPIQAKIQELYGSFFGEKTKKGDGDFIGKRIELPDISGLKVTDFDLGGFNLPTIDAEKIKQPYTEITNEMLRMSEVAQMTNNTISNSFQGLANTIAGTLEQNMGIFGVFVGEMIKQMSRYLLKDAAFTKGKLALDATKAKGNYIVGVTKDASKIPFASFALPALIAGGLAAIGSAFSKIGNVSNNTDTGSINSRSSGISRTFGGGSSNGSREVVFRLQGTDLVGSFVSTLERNRNLGGQVRLAIN